jgi:uncharacterized protein (TIGR03067 family)
MLILAVGLLMAPDAPKDDAAKKEYEKFTGTWKIESLVVEGTAGEAEQIKDVRLVLKGNRFTLKQGDVSTYGGTYVVDVSKKPKTIDILFESGPEKGNKALGIYELEGDTYKVCIALAGKQRPTEFASKPGSGLVLEVLKREK